MNADSRRKLAVALCTTGRYSKPVRMIASREANRRRDTRGRLAWYFHTSQIAARLVDD